MVIHISIWDRSLFKASVEYPTRDAPRCAVAPALRGVALLERTNITCAVDADPVNVSFNWTFNNSLRRDQDQTLPSSR
ncbi:hypothetical protein E2C01_075320 [Portunus trituberculatus]|uniref:Ig-like domain-containing protein n=1 Tax=Portunus trituberculatus TaxID=210409 RepID=A0A5B7IAF4_PORTR|nr:hypothetical protein [Portunus trituberculatus]